MNSEKLEAKMREKGISKLSMCKRLGISRSAFYRKCNGLSEFTLTEIQDIIKILQLDTPVGIFFDSGVS